MLRITKYAKARIQTYVNQEVTNSATQTDLIILLLRIVIFDIKCVCK